MRPALVMSAGMMPALDLPGLMMPGQFGPMMPRRLALRVGPERGGVVHRDALGDDDGQRDLGVDRLDHRVLGERRRHEADRHVRAGLAHRLGDRAEHRQRRAVDVDLGAGLAGVDAADDLAARGEHAAGVLHALGAGHALHDDLAVLVKPDAHGFSFPAFASSAALSAASSIVSTSVTSGWFGLGEDRGGPRRRCCRRGARPAAWSPRRPSMLSAVTMPLATASHAVMPPKTLTKTLRTDGSLRMMSSPLAMTSAERAAADVEEVGGLDAAVLLAGVGDDVEGRHDQPGAVADDADLAVELDVVEVLLLGLRLERVGRLLVLQLGVAGLPEVGVVVEGDLAVERDDAAVAEARQRVDLDQRRVLLDEGLPELHQDVGDRVDQVLGELGRGRDLAGLGLVHAVHRVDGDAGQRVGALDRELLDLHAALVGRHRQEGAVRAVEQEGDVVLLLDVRARVDEHAVDRVALDVHAEDLLGGGPGVVGGLGHLDAAGLAAAADLHLGLDDGDPADALGDRLRLVGRGGDLTERGGYAVGLEQVLRLVLEQIHSDVSSSDGVGCFDGSLAGAVLCLVESAAGAAFDRPVPRRRAGRARQPPDTIDAAVGATPP